MNRNIFMSRKRKYGEHPSKPINRHRRPLTDDELEKTSRSRPLAQDLWNTYRKPHMSPERRWNAIFSGRQLINELFARAGVKTNL